MLQAKETGWYVYIIECKDGSFYTGITTNLQRRIKQHSSGKGAKYTKSHLFVKLLYSEPQPSRSTASKREAEIKSLNKIQKMQLVSALSF